MQQIITAQSLPRILLIKLHVFNIVIIQGTPPPEMINFFILVTGLQLKTHDVLIVSIYLHLISHMRFL